MRGWLLALGLSVAVHAALFSFVVASAPERSAPARERADALVSFTTVQLEAPAAPTLPLRARGEGRGEGRAVVAQETQASPPPSGEAVAEPAPTTAPQEGTQEAPHPDPPPVGAGKVTDPGPDVTALVHARLAAVADRCYPAAARRFQQRGTVQLAFCTDANGGARSTDITQSSGAELLDAAARGCVLENAARSFHALSS